MTLIFGCSLNRILSGHYTPIYTMDTYGKYLVRKEEYADKLNTWLLSYFAL